ncbi:hypothetical protein Ccrd_014005 [Cynara cardunculus var. scolymus]|uniref:Uncharacterized protein n=1 Tax=Cynara cardunculus var. scolymus TaxID=59895 RepID=A0A124SGW0_CYNCS|nr:hypothetical protein Ccrd_014005 [Cynara cardunculus var. scolymus]
MSTLWRWLVTQTRDSKPFFFAFATVCAVVPGAIGYCVMQFTNSSNEQLESQLRRNARPDTLLLEMKGKATANKYGLKEDGEGNVMKGEGHVVEAMPRHEVHNWGLEGSGILLEKINIGYALNYIRKQRLLYSLLMALLEITGAHGSRNEMEIHGKKKARHCHTTFSLHQAKAKVDLMMGKVNKERLGEYLGELQRKEDTNDRYIAALKGETLTRNPYMRIQPVISPSGSEVDNGR